MHGVQLRATLGGRARLSLRERQLRPFHHQRVNRLAVDVQNLISHRWIIPGRIKTQKPNRALAVVAE